MASIGGQLHPLQSGPQRCQVGSRLAAAVRIWRFNDSCRRHRTLNHRQVGCPLYFLPGRSPPVVTTTMYRRVEGRPMAAPAGYELELSTHCSRRRFSQRATGLLWKRSYAEHAEKSKFVASSRSSVPTGEPDKITASLAASDSRELALPTRRSRRWFSRRTTCLLWNFDLRSCRQKTYRQSSGRSQVATIDWNRLPAVRLHPKTQAKPHRLPTTKPASSCRLVSSTRCRIALP